MALELSPDVLAEVRGHTGFITLNRPKALNALSLQMVRDLMACLLHWQDDPAVLQVAVRGSNKEGPFGAFCAGGDIRFLREAALAGNPQLEDFFTEEYALNHLIHHYPKPYIAFMDGIVMGGGHGDLARRRRAYRDRPHPHGHARDHHRPLPRRGRGLLPEPLPRAGWRVSGADR